MTNLRSRRGGSAGRRGVRAGRRPALKRRRRASSGGLVRWASSAELHSSGFAQRTQVASLDVPCRARRRGPRRHIAGRGVRTVASRLPPAAKMPALKVIAGTVRRLKRESGRVVVPSAQDIRRAHAGAAPATVGESMHRNGHCASAWEGAAPEPRTRTLDRFARKPGDRPGARNRQAEGLVAERCRLRASSVPSCACPDPCRPRG